MTGHPAAILFGAGFTLASAWSLGTVLLRRMKLPLYREEIPVYSALLGAAVLGMLVFGICALHAAFTPVFVAVGLAAVAAAAWPGARRAHPPSLAPIPRPWKILLACVAAAYLLLYITNAMAPEVSPDGARYHLGLVSRYWRHHGFTAATTDLYANYSQAAEMLFLFAFAFGRQSAAALVHFLFLPALAWLILCYARRHGQPGTGVVAALLVFITPVIGIDSASAYNDVAVAAVLFAVFSLTEIWIAGPTRSLPPVIGLLAGFAYGIKYTAVMGAVYAVAAVAWTLRRKPLEIARPILVLLLCAAVFATPWMVKNAILAGNPLSPFFNSLFPNRVVDPQLESEYRQVLRKYPGIASWRQLPMELTVHGQLLQGFLGPVFLLAPLALLALRSSRGRRILAAALIFALPYVLNIGTRFLIPALPLLALALASVAIRVPGVAVALVLVHAVLSWPAVAGTYVESEAWRLRSVPWEAALRIVSEPAYLKRHLRGYSIARLIDLMVPPGERVFTFSDLPEAYLSRDIVTGGNSTFGRRLRQVLWTAIYPELQPAGIMRFLFDRAPYRRLRVVQTGADPEAVWSVTEFLVYQGEQPIPNRLDWRVDARPNPWEAPLAFDNDASTNWCSRRHLYPGMFLEVGFPKPLTADSVVLRCVLGQNAVRLRLEGSRDGTSWTTLDPQPDQFEGSPPLFLRSMAAQEFLANRIAYFVVKDDDFGKDDFLHNQRLWGIAELGEAGGAHLFRFVTPPQPSLSTGS